MPCIVVYCNVFVIVPSLKRKWLKIHSFMICSRMLWLQVQCLNHGNPCFFPTWPVSPVSPFLFWGRPEHIWWKSRTSCAAYYEPRAGVQPCWITDDFAWIIPTEVKSLLPKIHPGCFFYGQFVNSSGHLLQNITMEAICQIRWFTLW